MDSPRLKAYVAVSENLSVKITAHGKEIPVNHSTRENINKTCYSVMGLTTFCQNLLILNYVLTMEMETPVNAFTMHWTANSMDIPKYQHFILDLPYGRLIVPWSDDNEVSGVSNVKFIAVHY